MTRAFCHLDIISMLGLGTIMNQVKKFIIATMVASGMVGAYANDNHLNADQYQQPAQAASTEKSWNYDYPELWGDLPENRLCRVGQEQSPINITRISNLIEGVNVGRLSVIESYKPQDFVVRDAGHAITFDVAGQRNSKLYINGVPYQLLQVRYHTPSEHTVMSAHYPMEIHFIHQNAQGFLAIVGVLVNAGKTNPYFSQLIASLPTQNGHGVLRDFDVDALLPKDSSVYAYQGSLTTPPCTERVQWFVKTTPIHADSRQLSALSRLHDGNARPIQPQGNREVLLVK